MKKILRIALVMLLILMIPLQSTSAEDQSNDNLSIEKVEERYVYSALTNFEEWEKLDSIEERIKVTQIPEETLSTMTTRKLAQAVLDYPMLVTLFLYDNLNDGYNWVKQNFNGLRELMVREDGASELLRIYLSIEAPTLEDSSNVMDLNYLEVILAQSEFFDKLTTEQKESLFASNEEKYSYNQRSEKISTSFLQKALYEENGMGTRSSTSYVLTPRGTRVSTIVYHNDEELTATQKSNYNHEMQTSYPSARRLREPTIFYNCHSYAWHITSSSNRHWIEDPSNYMTDGSYVQTNQINVGDKVFYRSGYNGDHSGIVDSNSGTIYVISKWGAMGLYSHALNYCPYYLRSTISYWEAS